MLTQQDRTWAEIDLSALKHNFLIAKATNRRVMCVIKANAYGHGAVEVGKYLEKQGADRFAVACISEALELREAGIHLPILVLGYTPAASVPEAAAHDITLAVVDESTAREYDAEAKKSDVRLTVHAAIDTGMSRIGVLARGHEADAACALVRMTKLPNLSVEGMFTHLSVADTPSEYAYTESQLDCFERVRALLAENGVKLLCHAANSACILQHPRAYFDMVREGIILYGMYPDSRVQTGPLRPVMTLKSRVALVKEFPEGASVSYGRTYRTDKPFTSAVITCGYADGYPRRMSNQGGVVIGGKRYPQLGRVCMDMMMADVTGADVHQGDEVVLFGSGGPTLEEVAGVVGTINYELSCLVTPRVPRVYVNGDNAYEDGERS